MITTVCVAGLGLIGASMAKAIKKHTSCRIYGWNRTQSVTERAIGDGLLAGEATDAVYHKADLVIVALYSSATIEYMHTLIPKLKPGSILIDIAVVKTPIISSVEQKAKDAGVVFIGGHPMAGIEVTGYDNAFAELFSGASMILVPTVASPSGVIEQMVSFFKVIGFGRVVVTTSQEHDRMIAYTSQLAHVVSNAFVKSEASERHSGFSAGSYRDLTRVARLDEQVWKELFLLNREPLLCEIDEFLENMHQLRDCIEKGDSNRLAASLRHGSDRKIKFG